MRKVFFLLLIILVPAALAAQDNCLEQFRQALENVKKSRSVAGSKGFEMICQIVVTPEQGEVYRERMEIVALGSKYKYSSLQFSLYQDSKTTVVIQHDEKTVFVTRPVSEQLRKNQFDALMRLQDSLQQHLVFKSCSKEFGAVKSNEGYQKLVFVPGKSIEDTGLKSISYWLESGSQQVVKISIDYVAGSGYGIRKYDLIIDKMAVQAKRAPFEGEALSYALRNNKLLNEYKDYELIDKRN